ncbi:LOW QUALITY PROTEIN: ORF21 protein [Colletotrichum tofieldiae]|nr:LOW QUALITY PROTEIN: ORF21 protein [Colletotrichum tofieldiae]
MAFKRKRSEAELFTSFNSPARSESSIESFESPVSPSPMYPRAYVTPSHLPSRTRKRFRDNRPSENQVHLPPIASSTFVNENECLQTTSVTERTLNMLYSAQQQSQHIINQTHDANLEPSPAPAARNTQKSLHSFWNIKSAAPSLSPSSAPSVDQAVLSPISCDDCGTG